MAKDPAFLFYSSDFLTGTLTMNNEQVGKYIRLMCLQHQKGRLTEKEMLHICDNRDEEIFSKFKTDENGLYYNERLDLEASKRKAFTDSRRSNRNQLNNEDLFVYIMLDEATGNYKIGSSVNPERRFLELRNTYPTLKLLYQFGKTSQKTESLLQKKYASKNVINEFFKLTETDIKNIITHMTVDMKLHMTIHMENENEIENKDIIETKDIGGEGEKGKFKIDPKMEIPPNLLELAEMNQWTLTNDRNTEFIKSQWTTFLMERVHDPPGKKMQYRRLSDITSYFLNWIRNKHPNNGSHKQTSSGSNKKSGISSDRIEALKNF